MWRLNVSAPGVLSNDTDDDSDPLTAVLDIGPANGSLTLNANGSFDYTPDQDFSGADTFTYHANDGSDNSNVATVTITVNAVNDAPVANDDATATSENFAVNIDVLLNDSDVDGTLDVSSVTVTLGPTNGSASLTSTVPPRTLRRRPLRESIHLTTRSRTTTGGSFQRGHRNGDRKRRRRHEVLCRG